MKGWQRALIWSAAGSLILIHTLLMRMIGAIDTDVPDPSAAEDLLRGAAFALRFHGALFLAPLVTRAHPLVRAAVAVAMVPGAWHLATGFAQGLERALGSIGGVPRTFLVPLFWIGAYALGFYILARGARPVATQRAA